jgi:predicted unusual protein kinase regulating ubiquinone biosynthesis (AarF/ABC1/UbiB family)
LESILDNYKNLDKIKRFAGISKTLGGFIIRSAGEKYLNLSTDDHSYAQYLKENLGEMRGVVVKILQFLATIPDAMPKEYSEAFLDLQSHAPAMNESFVRRRMSGELGNKWRDLFVEFDLKPAFSASLGQVHKAKNLEGDLLACKLQYPSMQKIIDDDIEKCRFFLLMFKPITSAIDVEEVLAEIKERLIEETSYINESKNLHIFSEIFVDCDFIKVPKTYNELSTDKMLTMSWLDGKSIFSYINHDLEVRNKIAEKLFYAWYMPFYKHHIMHCDPHTGNYLIDDFLGKDHFNLQLLDFGCVKKFSKDFINNGVIKLYRALESDNKNMAYEAYEAWGFKNLNYEIIEALNQWAKLLYDPLLDNRVRSIQEGNNALYGWQVAKKVYDELKKIGKVTPPKNFVFMDRVAVGLGGAFMRLKAELNWCKMFKELVHE